MAPIAGGDDEAAYGASFVDGAAQRGQCVEGRAGKKKTILGLGFELDVGGILKVVEDQEERVRVVDLTEEFTELAA